MSKNLEMFIKDFVLAFTISLAFLEIIKPLVLLENISKTSF